MHGHRPVQRSEADVLQRKLRQLRGHAEGDADRSGSMDYVYVGMYVGMYVCICQ